MGDAASTKLKWPRKGPFLFGGGVAYLLTNRFNWPFASWEAFACLINLKPGILPGFFVI
jgi:hypothetical protein